MTNEKYYIAQKDFEAYNPHYDLRNPIKVNFGDLILCNGGMPEQMLHDNGVIGEKPCFTQEDYNNTTSMEDFIHFLVNTDKVRIVGFRTFSATNENKKEFNDNLLSGLAQVPLFYWLEDYENQMSNSPNSYSCITKDIFGKEIILPVVVKSRDSMVLSHDGTFIGFVEGYKTKKVDLAEIKKDILTDVNKVVDAFVKEISSILRECDK